MHGKGGIASNLKKIELQANHIMKHAIEYVDDSFYFVAPQTTKSFKENGGWRLDELNHFLSELKTKYKIDSNRVYLIGNSMGAMGAWIWAASNPEHFAAIAPISGGIKAKNKKHLPDNYSTALASTPIWAMAGGRDKVVPEKLSSDMIRTLAEAGNTQARFTLFPDAKHNVRTQILASPDIYNWLFSQSNK